MKIQSEVKNSPDFYHQAPFLTIAEDLLKLIKEGKIDRLIFLTAYDKKVFPDGDDRKEKIFKETFNTAGYSKTHEGSFEFDLGKGQFLPCYLQLIPFESETQGQSKVD